MYPALEAGSEAEDCTEDGVDHKANEKRELRRTHVASLEFIQQHLPPLRRNTNVAPAVHFQQLARWAKHQQTLVDTGKAGEPVTISRLKQGKG